jgi:hypothetical protein
MYNEASIEQFLHLLLYFIFMQWRVFVWSCNDRGNSRHKWDAMIIRPMRWQLR